VADALVEEANVDEKSSETPVKPAEPKRRGNNKVRIILPIVTRASGAFTSVGNDATIASPRARNSASYSGVVRM